MCFSFNYVSVYFLLILFNQQVFHYVLSIPGVGKLRPAGSIRVSAVIDVSAVNRKPMYRQFHRCIGVGIFKPMHQPMSSNFTAPEVSSTQPRTLKVFLKVGLALGSGVNKN